mmetsp:Transcript_12249/g.17612  ORF Transcript_12249/g.17612 Transcript_12249/m.17612 type:complete len:108 (+) Transcript_12249:182-505(+)
MGDTARKRCPDRNEDHVVILGGSDTNIDGADGDTEGGCRADEVEILGGEGGLDGTPHDDGLFGDDGFSFDGGEHIFDGRVEEGYPGAGAEDGVDFVVVVVIVSYHLL